MNRFAFSIALALCACGPAQPAETPAGETGPKGADKPATDDVPATPEKAAPPDVSDGEKQELAGTCAPLTTVMIEADAAAIRALDDALRDGAKDADDKALAGAVAQVKKSTEPMSPGDKARCLALFEKQERRKLFDHEPAEDEARSVVDSCIKRVEAVYGKQTMAFDMSGGNAQVQGPFCPDDFPVPPKLSQLPYQSSKEDWDTPAFRCLQFGLRMKQEVQFEYNSPHRSGEFTCIARYLPRKGGAPVEVFRGGKQDAEGHLLLAPKAMRRRMKTKS